MELCVAVAGWALQSHSKTEVKVFVGDSAGLGRFRGADSLLISLSYMSSGFG